MHTKNVNESITPTTAAWRKLGIVAWAIEDTRRYWRKVWKRNRGRKTKTLRTHRIGK